SDNKGAIAKSTVNVTVNEAANIPPTANAGNDITTVPSNASITLSGSGIDLDGTILSYSWKQVSGPAISTIGSENLSTTQITGLIQGTYQFELAVTDNQGAEGKDIMQVTVGLERLAPNTESPNLRVYPNPVHDIANVELNTVNDNTNILILIHDMTGKIVYKKQFLSASTNVKQQVDMSNLIKGTYVMTVYFDNMQKQSIKIVRM
ncbi:T9SS C-terminal target domain-containing protein, partial [Hanamia caeni]